MEDTFACEEPIPTSKRTVKKPKEKRISLEIDNVGYLVELDMELLKIARKKSIGKEMMESSMKIPKSLRSVAPFLEEAQCLFRYTLSPPLLPLLPFLPFFSVLYVDVLVMMSAAFVLTGFVL
jgi:hypothetical protein